MKKPDQTIESQIRGELHINAFNTLRNRIQNIWKAKLTLSRFMQEFYFTSEQQDDYNITLKALGDEYEATGTSLRLLGYRYHGNMGWAYVGVDEASHYSIPRADDLYR